MMFALPSKATLELDIKEAAKQTNYLWEITKAVFMPFKYAIIGGSATYGGLRTYQYIKKQEDDKKSKDKNAESLKTMRMEKLKKMENKNTTGVDVDSKPINSAASTVLNDIKRVATMVSNVDMEKDQKSSHPSTVQDIKDTATPETKKTITDNNTLVDEPTDASIEPSTKSPKKSQVSQEQPTPKSTTKSSQPSDKSTLSPQMMPEQ